MAAPVNARLVDPEKGIFEILGLVLVRISSPYWTHASDIEEETARGVIFKFVDTKVDEDRAIATVEVVDVTLDETEPEVSLLCQDDIAKLDQEMYRDITDGLEGIGITMVKWMSSKLNQTDSLSGLVTPYIVKDCGKDRQYIDLRFSAGLRKMVARGTFDIERSNELAAPIFSILKNMKICN